MTTLGNPSIGSCKSCGLIIACLLSSIQLVAYVTSLVLGPIITQKNQTPKNGLILSLFILHSPNRPAVFQDVFSHIFPVLR